MIFKPVDIILAAAPASAAFTLSHINDIAATAAAVLGVVYLGIGIALLALLRKVGRFRRV
jgi:hypothetical protein